MFSELDVHKCLISYGCLPILFVLREKELEEDYEACNFILAAIKSYKQRFPFIASEFKTQWSEQLEENYYSYFIRLTDEGELLAKKNMEFYIKDIKTRLKL